MKEELWFKCEICGRQFVDKDECIDHENNHVKAICIVSSQYDRFSGEYPLRVTVRFSDGQTQQYSNDENRYISNYKHEAERKYIYNHKREGK